MKRKPAIIFPAGEDRGTTQQHSKVGSIITMICGSIITYLIYLISLEET